MDFDLSACSVRLATPADKDDLIRVARGIWGGTDYLPKVLDRWIGEPWFWVCEYRGHAIACLKMTLFPDHVLWFEGLRVQTKYQNHGVATLLNQRSFQLASELKRKNPRLAFEFCTYYLNVESLHLTQKLGFHRVEAFFTLDKRGVKDTCKPEIFPRIDLSAFRHYPRYIPCAWQPVHNTPASLPFLQKYGCLFQTPHNRYYAGGLHERNITLLEPPTDCLKEDLPYFQHFFGSRKRYSIIMPTSFEPSLALLHQLGFRFWDDAATENMLVFKM